MNLFNITRLSRGVGLRRKSGRALIIQDGKLLVFLRRRHSRMTGEWIEYYSIPGGGVDPGESAEEATIRELYEEMGVIIELQTHVAHGVAPYFEHDVFTARIVDGVPRLMDDSEEALSMNKHNQFVVTWVDINTLNETNLRYYADYLPLIQDLAQGYRVERPLQLTLR